MILHPISSNCHYSLHWARLLCCTQMEIVQLPALVLAILAVLTSPASAGGYRFGVGDGLALVLFIVIGIIGVCALLGWIARKRSSSS